MLHESNAGQKILHEFEENRELNKTSRHTLISLVCDLLMELSNNLPQPNDVRMLCLELIEIFPNFKTEPSEIGGIVTENIFSFFLVTIIINKNNSKIITINLF